jgi:hypothetical protein
MKSTVTKNETLTREAILGLLSDEENARVSTLEAGPALIVGTEYIDLEHPSRGVRRTEMQMTVKMSEVLPRSAVQEATWSKICARIAH